MMRKRMEVSGMVICSSLGVDKMYTLATTNKIIIIFFIKNHPTLYWVNYFKFNHLLQINNDFGLVSLFWLWH